MEEGVQPETLGVFEMGVEGAERHVVLIRAPMEDMTFRDAQNAAERIQREVLDPSEGLRDVHVGNMDGKMFLL